MKDRIIGFVTRDTGLKLLSLFFAAVLWLIVVSVDDPITSRTFMQIPVELTNTEAVTSQGQIYEVEDGTDVVSIRVSAKRSVLDSLKNTDFKATADMSRMDGSLVPISVSALRYSNRIEDITIRGRLNVKVSIEKLVEKTFRIQVETKGAIADGYVIGQMKLGKDDVIISGPESVVDTISEAKIVVDMTGMAGDISTKEDIILADVKGNEIDSDELAISDRIVDLEVIMWLTKEVPIVFGYVGIPGDGFALSNEEYCTPGSIMLAGPASILRKTDSLVIPASKVDITGAEGNKDIAVDVTPFIPEGLSISSESAGSEVVVHVGVASLQTKMVEVPTANIVAINVPEGVNATIGGLGIVTAVNVRGLGDVFDNLDPATITGYVDVSTIDLTGDNAIPAAHNAKVSFIFPAGLYDGGNEVQAQVIVQYSDDSAGERADNAEEAEGDSDTAAEDEEESEEESEEDE